MSDPHSAYVQWFIRADGEKARSPHCAYEAGWHARDEKARQEQDDLREILDEHRKALRACKEERDRKTAERSELRGERDRERARAEATEGRVRELAAWVIKVVAHAQYHLDDASRFWGAGGREEWEALKQEVESISDVGPPPPTTPASTAGEPLDRPPALTDPAASEAMRETERADGGGEETTGEDRPALRFAPGTRLVWYPRSRSRPHYDERVLAVVVRDDGDGPWLMIRVRTKAGREIERWVERGELSLEPTGEASGAGEPAGK